MIEVSKLPLYIPKKTAIYFDAHHKPPYYINVLVENSNLLEVWADLHLKRQYHRYITVRPFKSFRPLQYLRQFHETYGLITIPFEQSERIKDTLFDDLSFAKILGIQRFKLKSFRQKRGFEFITHTFDLRKDRTNVLFYIIDKRKPFALKLDQRTIWPWLFSVYRQKNFIFDQVILVIIDTDKTVFVNLGFKDKFNPQRIYTILRDIKPLVIHPTQLKSIISEHIKDPVIQYAIQIYIERHPEILQNIDEVDWTQLRKKAILFIATGRDDIDVNQKQIDKIVESLRDSIIVYKFEPNKPNDIVLKDTDFTKLEHPPSVYGFRQLDYIQHVAKDIHSLCKTFEHGQYPLKLSDVKIEPEHTPPGELRESSLLRIKLTFKTDHGNVIQTSFLIPRLHGNTFKLYGKDYALVNQLAIKPIFFPKPHQCKIQTSYSAITLEYKLPTKKTAYYHAFIGGMKAQLALFLLYALGLDKTLSLFNIKQYVISDIKQSGKLNIRIGSKFLVVDKNQEKLSLAVLYSIDKIPWSRVSVSVKEDFSLRDYWANILISITKNYNAPIVVDNIFRNILDSASIDVLKKDLLPTDIFNLIKYGCERILDPANVDARNDLSKQRLRNSEIVIQHVGKLLTKSYSAYCVRRAVGDKDAQLEVNSTKLLSDIIQDPNMQVVERSSPVEELSYLVRVNPTGLGGLPTAEAVTTEYRNVHPSYYGSISVDDTPESGNVGSTQHLAIGAIVQNRGTFVTYEIDDKLAEKILSPLEALIPFSNCNEGARVLFATNQMRSAIPLQNPEAPIVQTGYEAILPTYLSDKFVKKAPCSGKIVKVEKDSICIECDKTKDVKCIDITPNELRSGQTIDIYSPYTSLVKKGDYVDANQVIAHGAGLKDGLLAFGVNLHTVIMPYRGYNFEDAIVISESTASKLTSLHIDVIDVQIKPNSTIVEIKSGGEVKAGEPLISFIPSDLSELIELLDPEIDTLKGSTVSIRSELDGYIERIEVYPGDLNYINQYPQLKPLYENFIKFYKKQHGKVPKRFTWAGQKIDGVILRFKVVYHVPMSVGDKMANRHGNKGVVGLVLPDNKMPKSPFGNAEVILNPLGIISRMNVGQVIELYCGLISHVISQKILELDRVQALNLLTQVYQTLDPIAHRDIIGRLRSMTHEEWHELLLKIRNGYKLPIISRPFKSFGKDQVKQVLQILHLKTKYKVYLPEFEEYTKNPVPVGWMYFEKLEHMSRWKLSARSTRSYLSKTLQPPAGKRKEGGQRLGELESWGLLAYSADKLFWEFWGPLSDDHVGKAQLVNEIIETGKCTWRSPQVQPTRDALIASLFARHLDIGIDIFRFMGDEE